MKLASSCLSLENYFFSSRTNSRAGWFVDGILDFNLLITTTLLVDTYLTMEQTLL